MAIQDPTERAIEFGGVLSKMPEVAGGVRKLRQAAVQEMRDQGMTYGEIGKKLGVHRNRAQQIAEGR